MSRVILVGVVPAGAALSLLPSGLDVLDQIGVWDAFEAVDQVKLEALELYVNGNRRARIPVDPAAFGKLVPSWVSQPALVASDITRARRCIVLSRFAFGVTEVKLSV